VFLGKHSGAQHEPRAGLQPVLGEELLGEVIGIFPNAGFQAAV
jgi:hypothetical protein